MSTLKENYIMEAGLYIAKPEFIVNNNNNNSIKTRDMNSVVVDNNNGLPKKKWSTCTVPSLSSLTEGNIEEQSSNNVSRSCSPRRNGHFLSTENLSCYNTNGGSGTSGSSSRRDSTETTTVVSKEEKLRTRRKSWHVGKFEKKRRKSSLFGSSVNIIEGGGTSSNHSSGTTSPNAYDKRRRSSWWNIFVPDHWPKSRKRRSSIDFTNNATTENIPYVRGKSRSVDHGFTSPFDLDSLRSKVEGRFESVDKLTKDTNGDSRSGSKEVLSDKKMQKPSVTRTITYKVESNDTLASVAARFDTTPSELAILNRLPSRTVFPGQIIKVPDKKSSLREDGDNAEATESIGNSSGQDDSSESENASRSRGLSESDSRGPDEAAEDDLLHHLHPASPKPGRAERVHSPSPTVPQRHTRIDRFLRINVRHVTDGQGVVSGVLLVTPNAVMFDPNVSDELVIERGPESYGVIAPMELVVNAAIYHDIAHMRVANQEPSLSDSNDKPEIYHTEKKILDSSLYRPKEERIDENKVDKPEKSHNVDNKKSNEDHIDEDSSDQTPSIIKEVNLSETLDSSIKRRTQSPSSRIVNKTDCSLAKDEQFPELCCKSSEESSICSCDEERDTGNAFPKAFDKDLISPNYYTKKREFVLKRSDELSEKDDGSHSGDEKRTESPMSSLSVEKSDSTDTSIPHLVEAENVIKHLEARRKSSLDHHWAIPNKARSTESEMSSHEEEEEGGEHHEDVCFKKLSCYDSGIDIRDPSFVPLAPIRKKSSYSDADILLSDANEFVPPVPIKQLSKPDEEVEAGQKKASVSFSLEDSKEGSLDQQHPSSKTSSIDETDKAESKKNKMLKRLSYPIAWMEGITSDKDDKESSVPSSAESSHPSHSSSSVFSKVFSSSPINMVTDFGSGLFLTKTPSEESGNKFQFPPSTVTSSSFSTPSSAPPPNQSLESCPPLRCMTPSSAPLEPLKKEGFSTFSPSSLISSVGRSSVSSFIRQQHNTRSDSTKSAGPRLDYRSMVSVEDMPELFVSFDIHAPLFPQLENLELIPRPARSCEDPPLYLRLRMGKPKNRKIPKTTTIMSYGKRKMRGEYWFSVPRNRVDELYKFLNVWVPHLYGDLDEKVVEEHGYDLIGSDTDIWDDEDDSTDDKKRQRQNSQDLDLTESWEVIKAPYAKIFNLLKNQADQFGSSETQPSDEVLSMSDELRRALYANSANSLDLELFLPDLNGTTEILTEDHRKQLCKHLPARAEGYTWSLVFTTSQHGFSLNSMYRRMNRIDSPILMVIQDTDSNVFGALTSCALKVSDHFYGNGESFLYTFTPEFHVYNWTGENFYFFKGNNDGLTIGSGDGKFGIWLDADLYQGRTEPCATYGNLSLVPQEDFIVKTIECWAFL